MVGIVLIRRASHQLLISIRQPDLNIDCVWVQCELADVCTGGREKEWVRRKVRKLAYIRGWCVLLRYVSIYLEVGVFCVCIDVCL